VTIQDPKDMVTDVAFDALMAYCRSHARIWQRAYECGGLRKLCKGLDINPDA